MYAPTSQGRSKVMMKISTPTRRANFRLGSIVEFIRGGAESPAANLWCVEFIVDQTAEIRRKGTPGALSGCER